MNSQKVLHYNAFSTEQTKGNPAGVVLEADAIDEAKMQAIAKAVGFNETVFVVQSDKADYRLRYFTPGHEINLCGHATVAATYALKTTGRINADTNEIVIETNVGVLPVSFETKDGELVVTMRQDRPQFLPFHGSVAKLAQSMGIATDEVDDRLPVVYGSTGTWTLLVPIRSAETLGRMQSVNQDFPDILAENPRSSVHPFVIDERPQELRMQARHFSSPYSGTIEDAVTGTASGVMGAYYLTYLHPDRQQVEFVVEQGKELGREGKVYVRVDRQPDGLEVHISGTGVFVEEFEVAYRIAK
ncbi:hypothetical protein PA598K_04598 [Paenibacillus sp. 598K]|uniref:PhzF family phenazine biosynthesis protein n=1 Tax=Paenibacillus sp. 598K TaxID=1117987 RepID=UPI000FF9D505|nr:PhzF family phenazine biosynthesis isomerase [Paenibacillus sp. 598K]GBF76150.1 hypothetical protein PA598K_04598 [Paenibacillus sp. 598K]